MTTDEQLIERIRSSFRAEVAGLEPPSDLVQTLRDEIARGRRGPARLRRLRLPSFGGVVAALVTCAALAFAVLLLVSFGHHRPTPTANGAPAGARQLVARLAVLRRPQNAADRGVPKSSLLIEGGSVIPKLTRLATTLRVGTFPARVYLAVQRPPASLPSGYSTAKRFSPRLGDQVYVVAVSGPAYLGEAVPAAALDEPKNVLVPSPPGGQALNAAVVPDGVVRVKWVFTGVDITHPKPITTYPKVQNNVAVSPAPADQGVLSRAVWYGTNGRVIASYTAPRYASAPSVSPQLYDQYAVFRRSTAGQPRLPARIAKNLTDGANAGYGLDAAKTQYVAVTRGLRVWIVPGASGKCLVWSEPFPRPSGSQAQSNSRFSAACNALPSPLIGKVPDGRGNVTTWIMLAPYGRTPIATTGTGASVRARVVENVAYATSASGIRSLGIR